MTARKRGCLFFLIAWRPRWCAALVACGVVFSLTAGAQSPLDQPLVRLTIPAMLEPCDVVRAASWIAIHAEIAMGVEGTPHAGRDECDHGSPHFPPPPGLPATTARAALDRLIAVAPDYAWREINGVVVVRPLAAWNDAAHFLNARVESFRATDADMTDALAAISRPLLPRGFDAAATWAASSEPGRQPFTVSFAGGTLFDALNAVVAQRGDLGWRVAYCGGAAKFSTATIALQISEPSRKRVRVILTGDPRRPGSPCAQQ